MKSKKEHSNYSQTLSTSEGTLKEKTSDLDCSLQKRCKRQKITVSIKSDSKHILILLFREKIDVL